MAAAADLINTHVEKYLVAHPEFRDSVLRKGEGEYIIDGREVKVGFCRQGFLVVHDGPLRQPFTDYVEKKEATAVYHQKGLKTSNLSNLAQANRISFGDEGNRYSRLDAMKVAKEQALFREKAANYVNEGQSVPADLRQKYEKALDVKLGKRQWRPHAAEPTAPSWWPVSPGAATSPASPGPVTPASHVPPPIMSPPPLMAAQPPQVCPNLFGPTPNLLGAMSPTMSSRKPRMSIGGAAGFPPGLGAVSPLAPPALGTAMSMKLGPGYGVTSRGGMKAVGGYPAPPMVAGRLCGA